MHQRAEPFPLRAVLGASLVTAMANLPVYLVGALAITMRPELGFSTAGTGVAVSMFMATSALAGPVLAKRVQSWGAVVSMRVAPSVTSLTLLAVATVVRSWAALVAVLLIAGVANATGQMAANLTLAEGSSPANDGLAFGIKQAAVPFATMLAGLSVPVFIGVIGWRWAFALAAGVAGAIAAVAPRFAVDHRSGAARDLSGRRRPGVQQVDRLVVGLVAAGAFFASGVAMSLAVFIVEYAVFTGWSSAAAGMLLAGCSVGVLATRVLTGWLIDLRTRRGRSPVALLPVGTMIVLGGGGILLVMASGNSPALLVVGAVLALCSGWGWPGLMHLAVVSMNRGAAAVSTGVILFGVFAGGVVMPAALGLMAERVSYEAGWALSAGFLAVAACAFLGAHWVHRHHAAGPGPGAHYRTRG